jgi:molybdate transport system substrate-binding protein
MSRCGAEETAVSPLRAKRCRTLFIAAVLFAPATLFGQLNVITSGGFGRAYQALIPAFEKQSGITVTTTRGFSQGNGPNTIVAQLRRGVTADVVILSKEGLDDLIAEGRIRSGTVVDLAQARLGVAVRAGLPQPDISTVQGFKTMVLRAKSVTASSTSGIYVTERLFPKLGIAKEVNGNISAARETEITILPVSEIVNFPGLDFVGPVPKEIQFVSVFSAAIIAGTKQPEASGQLIAFLASENAKAAIRNSGMERVPRQ